MYSYEVYFIAPTDVALAEGAALMQDAGNWKVVWFVPEVPRGLTADLVETSDIKTLTTFNAVDTLVKGSGQKIEVLQAARRSALAKVAIETTDKTFRHLAYLTQVYTESDGKVDVRFTLTLEKPFAKAAYPLTFVKDGLVDGQPVLIPASAYTGAREVTITGYGTVVVVGVYEEVYAPPASS